MRKPMRFAGIGIVVLALSVSIGAWAATSKAADKHDCQEVGQSKRIVCDKGPLRGKTFMSREAMVEGLQKESAAKAKAEAAKPSKTSVSKKKK